MGNEEFLKGAEIYKDGKPCAYIITAKEKGILEARYMELMEQDKEIIELKALNENKKGFIKSLENENKELKEKLKYLDNVKDISFMKVLNLASSNLMNTDCTKPS